MRREIVKTLLENNTKLVNTAFKGIELLSRKNGENKELRSLCSQIYNVLKSKNDKTWEEEEWCAELQKHLMNQ